jgi:formylglycine-generating enzyme required for sulfatase activity
MRARCIILALALAGIACGCKQQNSEWAKVIHALGSSSKTPPGSGPVTKNTPVEPQKATVPQPTQVEPELPLPPESLAFAGKKAGAEWSANGLQMTFCWCPAGTFIMGSPKDEKDRDFNYSSTDPVAVTLTKGFWLGKYELTQEQWEKVMETNLIQQKDTASRQWGYESDNPGATEWWSPDRLKWRPQRRARSQAEPYFGEGTNFPMYYVNHLESTDFCRKLTEQERKAGRLPLGWEYRLPTEAQWEYACRAGTKTATAFGDQLSSRVANFDGTLPYNGGDPWMALRRTQPIGSYPPNAWGLCDMHGNTWEWCRDWQGAATGGTDPEIKYGDVNRIVRGGSWRSPGKLCRSGTRMPSKWTTGDYETGLRVALVQFNPKPNPPEPKLNPTPLPAGILTNSIGMKLAPIPAGRYLMGSPADEPYHQWLGRDEIDYEEQHPVTISEPFYLGVYLVTQEQWDRMMTKTRWYKPSYFSHEGDGKEKVKGFKDTKQFPRESIWAEEIQEFCRLLSELPEEKKASRVYRLPTEEEWEYACRAGTTTPYYFGNTITPQQGNFGDNVGRTTPVGYYNYPNKFGLYDLHGNLLQWCEGRLAPYQKDLVDPGTIYPGVARGGFWGVAGVACRSASRHQGGANMYTGLRLACSVSAGSK